MVLAILLFNKLSGGFNGVKLASVTCPLTLKSNSLFVLVAFIFINLIGATCLYKQL